jgi:hypothetical protein
VTKTQQLDDDRRFRYDKISKTGDRQTLSDREGRTRYNRQKYTHLYSVMLI